MDWALIWAFLTRIDWATLANVAVVISAWFIVRQLIEMRRTTQAQSYSVAREILQDEKVRQARSEVFRLGREGKDIGKWSREEIQKAEITCHTYDAVGQMVRHNLLDKDIIVDSWGPSLRQSWPIVAPLVKKYRQDWDAPELWDDYEWLAGVAIASFKKRKRKERWASNIMKKAVARLRKRSQKPVE